MIGISGLIAILTAAITCGTSGMEFYLSTQGLDIHKNLPKPSIVYGINTNYLCFIL